MEDSETEEERKKWEKSKRLTEQRIRMLDIKEKEIKGKLLKIEQDERRKAREWNEIRITRKDSEGYILGIKILYKKEKNELRLDDHAGIFKRNEGDMEYQEVVVKRSNSEGFEKKRDVFYMWSEEEDREVNQEREDETLEEEEGDPEVRMWMKLRMVQDIEIGGRCDSKS